MAKKSVQSAVNQYAAQQESIRKAKGNPNKNQHAKKKNSNYRGYDATGVGAYAAAKVSKVMGKTAKKVALPTGLKVLLGVLMVGIFTTLVLRIAYYKDSLLLTNISSLLLGITCSTIFYVRRHYHKDKTGALYGLITIVLAVFGVLYTVVGVAGLMGLVGP